MMVASRIVSICYKHDFGAVKKAPGSVRPLGGVRQPTHPLLRLALADQDHIGIGVTTDKTQFAVVE